MKDEGLNGNNAEKKQKDTKEPTLEKIVEECADAINKIFANPNLSPRNRISSSIDIIQKKTSKGGLSQETQYLILRELIILMIVPGLTNQISQAHPEILKNRPEMNKPAQEKDKGIGGMFV